MSAPKKQPSDPSIREEQAAADAKAVAELRALKLPVEREPVTVFRAKL